MRMDTQRNFHAGEIFSITDEANRGPVPVGHYRGQTSAAILHTWENCKFLSFISKDQKES